VAVKREFHEVQESLDLRPEAEDEFNVEGVIRRNELLLLHPAQPAFLPLLFAKRVLGAFGALGLLLGVEMGASMSSSRCSSRAKLHGMS
jgi:hypothetical protein